MRSTAIDPLGPAPADSARDPYRAERLLAQSRAESAARAKGPTFARLHAARQTDAAASAPNRLSFTEGDAAAGTSVNSLRDSYTAHCLKLAIAAYHAQRARLEARALAVNQALRDEQAMLQARAQAANDLGTIQGLLPQLAYRYAAGVPPVVAQQWAAVAAVAPDVVGPVAPAAKPRTGTERPFGGNATTG